MPVNRGLPPLHTCPFLCLHCYLTYCCHRCNLSCVPLTVAGDHGPEEPDPEAASLGGDRTDPGLPLHPRGPSHPWQTRRDQRLPQQRSAAGDLRPGQLRGQSGGHPQEGMTITRYLLQL